MTINQDEGQSSLQQTPMDSDGHPKMSAVILKALPRRRRRVPPRRTSGLPSPNTTTGDVLPHRAVECESTDSCTSARFATLSQCVRLGLSFIGSRVL